MEVEEAKGEENEAEEEEEGRAVAAEEEESTEAEVAKVAESGKVVRGLEEEVRVVMAGTVAERMTVTAPETGCEPFTVGITAREETD